MSDTGPGRRMKRHPLLKSLNIKDSGWPCLMHHHRGEWNETQWTRRVWRNGGMKFVARGKQEKPQEKPTRILFRPPRNSHVMTETRTRDPSGGRQQFNLLRHGTAEKIIKLWNQYGNGGEEWLRSPDLWSGRKPWWNCHLTPMANFGEVRRAQLAKSTLLTSSLVPLGTLQIF